MARGSVSERQEHHILNQIGGSPGPMALNVW